MEQLVTESSRSEATKKTGIFIYMGTIIGESLPTKVSYITGIELFVDGGMTQF